MLFQGFSRAEIDSSYIIGYERNGLYNTPKDTIYFQGIITESQSGVQVELYRFQSSLSLLNDYKVFIKDSSQVYTISDFEFEEKYCNKCFFGLYGVDPRKVLSGYKINNQFVKKYSVEIIK